MATLFCDQGGMFESLKVRRNIMYYLKTVFSLNLVFVHVLVWLYIFDMASCESFLFGENGSSILKQLVLITPFIQK